MTGVWRVRIALLACAIYFGGSLPAYKMAGETLGPSTTNAVRFLIAVAILVVIARRALDQASGRWRRLLTLGGWGIGLMAVFIGLGVDVGSASVASLVVGLEPIGVAIGGLVIARSMPSRMLVTALCLGLLGTAIAAGFFTLPLGDVKIVSIAILLGMVTLFSLYTMSIRSQSRDIDPLVLATVTQIGALIVVLVVALSDLGGRGMIRGPLTPSAAVGIVWLGVGSAIAYLLLCRALAGTSSDLVALSLYLIPVIGVLLSWLLADEQLSARHAVGAATILLAIWIGEGLPGMPTQRQAEEH